MKKGIWAVCGLVIWIGHTSGCAREGATGLQGTPASTQGTLAGEGEGNPAGDFAYNGVEPAGVFATVNLEEGEEEDTLFSMEGGFADAESADLHYFYWYLDWDSEESSPDPALSGQGLHTIAAEELVRTACEQNADVKGFELYVVATPSSWTETQQADWTSQAGFVFWNWSVDWKSNQCKLAEEALAEVEEEQVSERESADEETEANPGSSE